MTHSHRDFVSDVLPDVHAHLAALGDEYAVTVTTAGDPPVDEARIVLHGVPSGVTIACVDGKVGVNRHNFASDGDLSGVQLGMQRSLDDVAGILSDLDDRLAAKPLARSVHPLFGATSVLVDRLGQEGVAVRMSEAADDAMPFEIDRIRLLDHAGDPTGVEVIVAENAAWVRMDGEDGHPLDHDQMDETVAAALEAVSGPAMAMA